MSYGAMRYSASPKNEGEREYLIAHSSFLIAHLRNLQASVEIPRSSISTRIDDEIIVGFPHRPLLHLHDRLVEFQNMRRLHRQSVLFGLIRGPYRVIHSRLGGHFNVSTENVCDPVRRNKR